MKLEHRKQKIAPVPVFMLRLVKYGLLSLILLIVSLVIGTLGYHFLGNFEWLDSFLESCMILSGMGPIGPLKSEEVKYFSSLYALYSGIAFLSVSALFLAPIIHRLLHILHFEGEDDK